MRDTAFKGFGNSHRKSTSGQGLPPTQSGSELSTCSRDFRRRPAFVRLLEEPFGMKPHNSMEEPWIAGNGSVYYTDVPP